MSKTFLVYFLNSKELLSQKLKMMGLTALDRQQESVQAQYLAPLIANGANGDLAANLAETSTIFPIKSELLKFQPNMEEEYVQGLQPKSAI